MISIEDRKRFANAEAKARHIRPLVRFVEFGTYTVPSSRPGKEPYTVKFSKDAAGHWQAECDCLGHRKGLPCYHVPAAYASHRIQVNVRKQLRAAQPVAPVQNQFQILPVEEARGQAAEALTALVVDGVITTSMQEIDRLIEQANEVSMDRECPNCGLVQPDDDSTDCFACRTILDPDDEDPDPEPDPVVCVCGNPGFSYFNGRWHCWACVQQLAEAEAEKDAVRKLKAEEPDEAFNVLHEELFGFVSVQSSRVKEAW